MLATIAFTWFFQNALQSVLLAMVVHAMNNTISGEYFSQMFDGSDSTRQSWMLVVTWGIAARSSSATAGVSEQPEVCLSSTSVPR